MIWSLQKGIHVDVFPGRSVDGSIYALSFNDEIFVATDDKCSVCLEYSHFLSPSHYIISKSSGTANNSYPQWCRVYESRECKQCKFLRNV